MHAVEEELSAPDPCFAEPCTCLLIDDGRRELRDFRLHSWSGPAGTYERLRPALVAGGAVESGAVGDADALLLDAAATYRIACDAVAADRCALMA